MPVTIGDSRWRLRWGRGWLLRGALSTLLRVKGEEEGGGEGASSAKITNAYADGTRVSSICALATSGS